MISSGSRIQGSKWARRTFVAAIGCACVTLPSSAWPQARIYRVGYLHPNDAHDAAYTSFMKALKERGYVVGKNVLVEERFANDKPDRLPGLAEELVAARVDVIVAVGPGAIRAARGATRTVPIVMAFSGEDPVKSGFAESLSRPGGNTTGLTAMSLDIAPKKLEFLRDMVPGLARTAVLRSRTIAEHTAQVKAIEDAAQRFGIRLQVELAGDAGQYPETFARIASAGNQAVLVLSGPEFTHNRQILVSLAAQYRLPSMFSFADIVEAGGLASYGPGHTDLSSRAVDYVDRILHGANPADMPIQQPTTFELVINRKTAKELGLTIPPALLVQATVIG
ncbi:ABC transporter substrate-binding protein [Variovorax robiniae]|uniref:ABC transporter substrate-binding protein n=1 Tax=Variovorax robiniae TaxID=1836199 RepID=A0ABU8X7L2_9BURK